MTWAIAREDRSGEQKCHSHQLLQGAACDLQGVTERLHALVRHLISREAEGFQADGCSKHLGDRPTRGLG